MIRKHPISVLIYNSLYPNPTSSDPPSFSAHLSKYLVGEVRIETATFYGSLDTIEARYPGLNYAYAPHRKRLSRFPHHKKLFEAFDKLGLTDSEIQGFCRWEGTLWARERYERDEGVKVRDTTGMEIGVWVDRRKARTQSQKQINVKTDIEVEIEEIADTVPASSRTRQQQYQESSTAALEDTEMQDSDSESEDEGESVGFELNQRLLRAAAMREQGINVEMDPEWEQFLKDAQERGELNIQDARLDLQAIPLHIEATQQALRDVATQLAELSGRQQGLDNATTTTTTTTTTTQQSYPTAPA